MQAGGFRRRVEKKGNYCVFSVHAESLTADFTTHLHCVSYVYLTVNS
jgi:hypothetical protein